ncbi:MAG: hypothetical protein AAGF36_16730 [Pseudomonadota bacterium]
MHDMLRKGCLMAALLFFAPAVWAAEDRFPRANLVGCAKAVDGLGDTLRAPMQNHCLSLAIAKCEAPDSGPAQACFSDLERGLASYGAQLEAVVDVDVPRAASDTLCALRFSNDTDRARCALVAEFGHFRDLLNAAQAAKVDLP